MKVTTKIDDSMSKKIGVFEVEVCEQPDEEF
jgi:hypothetical protein